MTVRKILYGALFVGLLPGFLIWWAASARANAIAKSLSFGELFDSDS